MILERIFLPYLYCQNGRKRFFIYIYTKLRVDSIGIKMEDKEEQNQVENTNFALSLKTKNVDLYVTRLPTF